MRGRIIGFLLGLLIGLPAGAFLWYAVSPLFIDRVVNEALTDARIVATGQFRDADRAHRGRGTARLVALAGGGHEVQFTDFEVTNGPDLEVWLSAVADPSTSAEVTASPYLSLGPLKGNIGSQSYAIPAGTAVADYRSVVIWCEQFGVLFSPAGLSSP